MTEQIRQRYEDALKWLHDVAAGRASPGPGETQDGHGGQSGNPDEAMVASRPAVNWRRYP
jgi:phage gp36-like protein